MIESFSRWRLRSLECRCRRSAMVMILLIAALVAEYPSGGGRLPETEAVG